MYDIAQINSVYDDLAHKIKTDLDEQFNRGRIKGTDYATVYSNLMNTILQLSFDAPLKDTQVLAEQEQINVQKKQELLIDAQTDGVREDIKVKQKQEALIEAQTQDANENVILKKAQEALYRAQTDVAERQKQSYDDSIRLKLFKAQMDTWGIMFSSGMLEDKPSVIKNDEVSSLYNDIKNNIR